MLRNFFENLMQNLVVLETDCLHGENSENKKDVVILFSFNEGGERVSSHTMAPHQLNINWLEHLKFT